MSAVKLMLSSSHKSCSRGQEARLTDDKRESQRRSALYSEDGAGTWNCVHMRENGLLSSMCLEKSYLAGVSFNRLTEADHL